METLSQKSPELATSLLADIPELRGNIKVPKLSTLYADSAQKVAAALKARERALDKVLTLKDQLNKAEDDLAQAIIKHEEADNEAKKLRVENDLSDTQDWQFEKVNKPGRLWRYWFWLCSGQEKVEAPKCGKCIAGAPVQSKRVARAPVQSPDQL